jgi:hypothetical protein
MRRLDRPVDRQQKLRLNRLEIDGASQPRGESATIASAP